MTAFTAVLISRRISGEIRPTFLMNLAVDMDLI